MKMPKKCLHCGKDPHYYQQVQGIDECYTNKENQEAEIWECSQCYGLIKVYLDVVKTVKLVEEE